MKPAPDEEKPLEAGDLVAGRYKVIARLGAGGMGTVYTAEHTWTRRRVALKVLRAELGANERAVSRFLREARACTKLSHPHVVQVLDMGQDESDGALFLVQELLDGADLRAVLARKHTLTPAEALAALGPVARALEAVHAQGVLHRDVKPENLFLHREGADSVSARVIDFGVARELIPDPGSTTRTQLGIPVGTPRYMSPEQARGDEVLDGRTDVWSLGAVLYEALCGSAPFEAPTATVLIAKILTERPRPLRERNSSVPEGVARVVDAALEPARAGRTASMRAFAEALERARDALCDEAALHAGLRALRRCVDGPGPSTAALRDATRVSTGTKVRPPSARTPAPTSREPEPRSTLREPESVSAFVIGRSLARRAGPLVAVTFVLSTAATLAFRAFSPPQTAAPAPVQRASPAPSVTAPPERTAPPAVVPSALTPAPTVLARAPVAAPSLARSARSSPAVRPTLVVAARPVLVSEPPAAPPPAPARPLAPVGTEPAPTAARTHWLRAVVPE